MHLVFGVLVPLCLGKSAAQIKMGVWCLTRNPVPVLLAVYCSSLDNNMPANAPPPTPAQLLTAIMSECVVQELLTDLVVLILLSANLVLAELHMLLCPQ